MRANPTLVGVLLVLLALDGCGPDDDPAGPGGGGTTDTSAPGVVTDLHVQDFDATQATIAWTATGDDGTTGTAHAYEIGYSGTTITSGTWATCSKLATCPAPETAGTLQSARIDAPPTPDLYVALRCVDEAGNWSALSNVAHARLAGALDVVQLTHEGNNFHPCVNDGFVTWVGRRTAAGDEIWIANLHSANPTPTVLTDNGGEKWYPSSHGAERIVWQGKLVPGDDWEIFVYSAHSIPRYSAFTDNFVHDLYPSLAGAGHFVWLQGPIMFSEVRYWNESLHQSSVLSDDCCPTTTYTNERPAADDFSVVWRSTDRVGSGGNRAHLWNGGYRDITDEIDGQMSHDFSIDDGTLAYEWGSTPAQIRYWDGATVQSIANGADPSLCAGWVAFEGYDGRDWEIYLWDGETILQITDNDFGDYDPSLTEDLLVWSGRPTGPGGAYQIYYTRLPEPEASSRMR